KRLAAEYGAVWERLDRSAVIDSEGDLTALGHQLAVQGGKPEHLRLIELADEHGCLVEAAGLLAFVDERVRGSVWRPLGDLHAQSRAAFRRSRETLWTGCDDDLDVILKLVHVYRVSHDPEGWSRRHGIDSSILGKIAERQAELLRPLAVRRKSRELR